MMYIMEEAIGVGLTKQPRRKSQHLETMRMLMEWKQDLFAKYPDAKSAAPKFPKDGSFLDQIMWSRKSALTPKEKLAMSSVANRSKWN
jgi:hypothetical protein